MKKYKIILYFTLLLCLIIGMTTNAEEDKGRILCVYDNYDECVFLKQVINACGLEAVLVDEEQYDSEMLSDVQGMITMVIEPMQDAKRGTLPVIGLGLEFDEIEGKKLEKYENVPVEISYKQYQEKGKMATTVWAIENIEGQEIGEIKIEDVSMPFAVVIGKDYYIPYYEKTGFPAFIVGDIVSTAFEISENEVQGGMYVLLDEVYPFSNLRMLCDKADVLYNNGIPFIVRIMPVYDNLEYPSFKRYAQVLRYIQAKNGTIVIHEPLERTGESEREPLQDKMERFLTTLQEEKIHYVDFTYEPFFIEWEDLREIACDNKNFGMLGMDCMFSIDFESSEEEFNHLLEQINAKWLSLSDYKKKFTTENYQYYEEKIDDSFTYREEEKVSFANFFATSNQILIIVVAISLCILVVLLVVGRRWYRRKFYR